MRHSQSASPLQNTGELHFSYGHGRQVLKVVGCLQFDHFTADCLIEERQRAVGDDSRRGLGTVRCSERFEDETLQNGRRASCCEDEHECEDFLVCSVIRNFVVLVDYFLNSAATLLADRFHSRLELAHPVIRFGVQVCWCPSLS